MFSGSAIPSPLPSTPNTDQVPGMNCIGPTARSYVASPSSRPPSVSEIPVSTGPSIGTVVVPSSRSVAPPYLPWSDSTRPIAASNAQSSPHVGSVLARVLAALTYARITTYGMPDAVRPVTTSPCAVGVVVGVFASPLPPPSAPSWTTDFGTSSSLVSVMWSEYPASGSAPVVGIGAGGLLTTPAGVLAADADSHIEHRAATTTACTLRAIGCPKIAPTLASLSQITRPRKPFRLGR